MSTSSDSAISSLRFPFQETVEAEGHLIDSQILELVFDEVVQYGGRFEVEEFRIGRTNEEPSYLRLRVATPTQDAMQRLLQNLSANGCYPVAGGDARLQRVERDCCAPEDFYSSTNHRTLVRVDGEWLEVRNQRMDALLVVEQGAVYARRLRDLRAGDAVVVGLHGVRVIPGAKERDRHAFAFMSNGVSSERQVEMAVRQTASLMRHTRERGQDVVIVAGPVVIHTGGVEPVSRLIRAGLVQALLAGNALGVHDIEAALLGTSLGVRLRDGRLEEHGHRNHMRAINRIYHCGDIRGAVEQKVLTRGILYECVRGGVPFVLAGSLRDDGPLPDTVTDMNRAQDLYATHLRSAGMVLCLGSMLHSIAVGNMLPSWVKIVCVDINPAVATKISDRGTGQLLPVITDVGLFLDLLARHVDGGDDRHRDPEHSLSEEIE
ncbi:MAG: TIGR00300 family protein [Bryobacterales bacterium]|jgi:lysine-ketoglutarate reductase/saccharopine dehydrogenase-like protein (TIGR00300 family)|nr:TIGR00300 family protein [Bryobacterales bacterium]